MAVVVKKYFILRKYSAMVQFWAIFCIIATIIGVIAADYKLLKGNIFKFLNVFKKKNSNLNFHSFIESVDVQDIIVENIFNSPVTYNRFKSEVISVEDSFEPYIDTLFKDEIDKKKLECSEHGITFDNNGSFSLLRIDIERPEGDNGKRVNNYKLILKNSDYHHFVFPNSLLDKEEVKYYNPLIQESQTLREITGLYKNKLNISNLSSLSPYHFKIGTGTLLITNDGFLICAFRSKKQFISRDLDNSYLRIHLSTGEGMFRSVKNYTNSDLINGLPNPFATSFRSLYDELNINKSVIDKNKIFCLGYFMDVCRAQPFFIFYYKSDISKEEVFDFYNNSPEDIHENAAIIALKWTRDNIMKIFDKPMLNELDYDKPSSCQHFFESTSHKRITIASNQAKIGFATAIWRDFFHINSEDWK